MRLIRRWYNIVSSYQKLLMWLARAPLGAQKANDHTLLLARLLANN